MNGEQMPDPGRVHEQHGAAPVHLGVERLELGLGDRAAEADDVHVDADAAQLVEAALHLLQRRVDMRQGQHHVGADPVGVAVRELGIGVVQHLDRGHAFRLVRQIGRMVRRQDLPADPGLVHQPEAALDVLRRIRERVQRHAALDRQMHRRGKPVAHELAEILRRVVRVHIADHRPLPHSRCWATTQRTVGRAHRLSKADQSGSRPDGLWLGLRPMRKCGQPIPDFWRCER